MVPALHRPASGSNTAVYIPGPSSRCSCVCSCLNSLTTRTPFNNHAHLFSPEVVLCHVAPEVLGVVDGPLVQPLILGTVTHKGGAVSRLWVVVVCYLLREVGRR